jgi:hypothetical protein
MSQEVPDMFEETAPENQGPFVDFEKVFLRMRLRVAMESTIDRLPTEKQQRAVRALVSWVIDHPDAEPNWSDIAREERMPQSSYYELLGRALENFKELLLEDPVIREWLETGEALGM